MSSPTFRHRLRRLVRTQSGIGPTLDTGRSPSMVEASTEPPGAHPWDVLALWTPTSLSSTEEFLPSHEAGSLGARSPSHTQPRCDRPKTGRPPLTNPAASPCGAPAHGIPPGDPFKGRCADQQQLGRDLRARLGGAAIGDARRPAHLALLGSTRHPAGLNATPDAHGPGSSLTRDSPTLFRPSVGSTGPVVGSPAPSGPAATPSMSSAALSRVLARILRHEVDRGYIAADAEGFVTFSDILA
eukprot:16301326-Heterocapsa_arctica.AAC.1